MRLLRNLVTSLYPDPDPDDPQRSRSIAWFLTTFTIVVAVIVLATVLIAGSSMSTPWSAPNFITFLGIATLTGATGFAGGGLVGFLFGLPRVRTTPGGDNGVDSNTNLEQVSDWLTKIIVGVSLVEFGKINGLLVSFGAEVNNAMVLAASASLALAAGAHGKAVTQAHAAAVAHVVVGGAGLAACLILIGSAIAGFLAAYLKAKTDLMEAFAPIDRLKNSLGNMLAEDIVAKAGKAALERPSTTPDDCARAAAAKLIQFVPAKSEDPDLWRWLGLAQAIQKNFKAAAEALQHAVDLQNKGPGASAELIALTTYALALSGKTSEAADLTGKADAANPDNGELAISELFNLLYTPGGFDAAIAKGEELKTRPKLANSGRLWLYLTCAYGQKHAQLKRGQADEKVLSDVRNNALEAARTALNLNRSGNLFTLQMIWDPNFPGKSPDENDLESLHDDLDFVQLLGPKST